METHYYSCAASVCAHMTAVSCAVATGGSSMSRCIFLHIEQRKKTVRNWMQCEKKHMIAAKY